MKQTSECFGSNSVPRINRGVDILLRDASKKFRKSEPARQ